MKAYVLSVDAAFQSVPLRVFKSPNTAWKVYEKCESLARAKRMHVETVFERSHKGGFEYEGMQIPNDVGGVKFSITEVDLYD